MIKKLRIEANLSQDELARRVGYTDRSSIAKIESGKVDLTETKIILFARALNVSPAELMGIVTPLDPSRSDSWLNTFRASIDNIIAVSDISDIADSNIDIQRLRRVSETNENISLSDACSIADELGTSLDEMVGLDKKTPTLVIEDERTIEFVNLFSQLTEAEQDIFLAQIKGVLASR